MNVLHVDHGKQMPNIGILSNNRRTNPGDPVGFHYSMHNE